MSNSAIVMDAVDGRFHSWCLPQISGDIVRNNENAVLAARQRAQSFLDEGHAAVAAGDFTTARAQLDDVVTSFSAHALDQDMCDRVVKTETATLQRGAALRRIMRV